MIKHVVPLSTIHTPMKVTRKSFNILVYIVPMKLAITGLHSYQDVVNVELNSYRQKESMTTREF